MGVACGDLDGDGRPDLVVTNFYGEGTTLYQNLGQGLFADRSAASGIGLATRYLLGFGIALVDVNNDGRLDVMITNGHVNDNRPFYPYAMPSRLYASRPDGRLVDVSHAGRATAGSVPRVGRGLAAGDLDNDGRVDALIVAQNEPLAYFHNRTRPRRPLRDAPARRDDSRTATASARGSPSRPAAGARSRSGSAAAATSRPATRGSTSASATATASSSVEVRWPSGRVDRWQDLAADTGYPCAKAIRGSGPWPDSPGAPPDEDVQFVDHLGLPALAMIPGRQPVPHPASSGTDS